MNGQCIAVVSGKGGTGKTSLTAGVGTALALSGQRVLCVDCDIGLRNLDISLGLSDRALMDFSDVAPSDLPEPLKSEPNVRELVKQQLKTYIGDSELGSLVDVDSIDVTTLCDEMVDQASYKITDVSATYNSCTVTVTTKNIDFYSLPGTIYDEIKSQITDGNSSLWTSIKNSISSLLGGSSQTSIEKIDISENLKNWYKETKKNGPTRKTTGKIVFGIKDGKWALISFDERLIYGYYGLRPLQ